MDTLCAAVGEAMLVREAARKQQVMTLADKFIKKLEKRDGVALFARVIESLSPETVRELAYHMRQQFPEIALVLGTEYEGKPSLTVALGDKIVERGVKASDVVRAAAKHINGGGGGQPHFASAGGKNAEGLQAAVDAAEQAILGSIN